MEAEVSTKSDNVIQLKKDDSLLRLKIRDENGEETGESLEFFLEDIELPLRYQQIVEEDKKNRANLRNQFIIIDKKEDHKGKKLLSSNEEAKIKAMQDFYKKEVEIYNMFLGEGGVEKLLNGRRLSWSTLDEIDEIIEKSILPQLQVSAEKIKEKIMTKYGTKREDIIE
jgi:hypothetical protein